MLPPFDGLTIAHTYSICAVNPETGEAGVAVASRALAVGSLVPYAQAGVGAIAIQGCVIPEYGTLGLRWLSHGAAAPDVLARLLARDLPTTPESDEKATGFYHAEGMRTKGDDYLHDKARKRIIWMASKIRQVGVVDRQGIAAVHNGTHLQMHTASRTSNGFVCQGNALTSPSVVEDMTDAYERMRSQGQSMDAALMNALLAAEAAGGDKRGTRAAALLVMRESGHWSGGDRHRDLRVDDDAQPVKILAQILSQF